MKAQEAANHNRSKMRPRATRYEIVTTVWYRVRGESKWQEGLLKNFSISGMLIAAQEPLEKGTNIEMRFTLPTEVNGTFAADVRCRGFVVRSDKYSIQGGAFNIAAKVLHSHLFRHTETEQQ